MCSRVSRVITQEMNMVAAFASFPTDDDISSDVERAMSNAYWAQLNRASEYADYVERMANLEADDVEEEDGHKPPTPLAAPALVGRVPARPLWSVLLVQSAGRVGPTKFESRAARRQ